VTEPERLEGVPGHYWHRLEDGRIQCDVCPRYCRLTCQNWDISKARELDRLQDAASPDEIVEAAIAVGSRSIASTYNLCSQIRQSVSISPSRSFKCMALMRPAKWSYAAVEAAARLAFFQKLPPRWFGCPNP
jgi:hypothetical protein